MWSNNDGSTLGSLFRPDGAGATKHVGLQQGLGTVGMILSASEVVSYGVNLDLARGLQFLSSWN